MAKVYQIKSQYEFPFLIGVQFILARLKSMNKSSINTAKIKIESYPRLS